MVTDGRLRWLRDSAVAFGLFVLLLAVMRVQFQPVQVPGYLLTVGFDAVQNALAPGLGGGGFAVAFAAYVLGLAALGGALAGRLRRRFGSGGALRYGLAGAVLAVVGFALALAVAVAVAVLPDSWSPVAIALAVGAAGLWAGTRLGARRRPAR